MKGVTVIVPDFDGDGVSDNNDTFPSDPSEWADSDGTGDACDAASDSDNDGCIEMKEHLCGRDPADSTSGCGLFIPWIQLLFGWKRLKFMKNATIMCEILSYWLNV